MNLAKLSIKDVNKIKDMHILNIYRYSLKLIRTYPSIKRDELREILILGKIITIILNRVQRKKINNKLGWNKKSHRTGANSFESFDNLWTKKKRDAWHKYK